MTHDVINNQDIYSLIRELAKALRMFQEGAVFCEDITFTQFVILDYIREAERLKLSDLHKLLSVEKSTTTRLLDPLVRKKLIVKDKSLYDSRAIELELTKEGMRIYDSVSVCMEDLLNQLTRILPEDERHQLVGSLSTFVDSVFRCCGKDSCC